MEQTLWQLDTILQVDRSMNVQVQSMLAQARTHLYLIQHIGMARVALQCNHMVAYQSNGSND